MPKKHHLLLITIVLLFALSALPPHGGLDLGDDGTYILVDEIDPGSPASETAHGYKADGRRVPAKPMPTGNGVIADDGRVIREREDFSFKSVAGASHMLAIIQGDTDRLDFEVNGKKGGFRPVDGMGLIPLPAEAFGGESSVITIRPRGGAISYRYRVYAKVGGLRYNIHILFGALLAAFKAGLFIALMASIPYEKLEGFGVRRERLIGLAAVFALIFCLGTYGWMASKGTFMLGAEKNIAKVRGLSAYGALSESFLSGRLDLDMPERPWADPETFPWDLSMHEGRYYMYFGPTPAIFIYMPYMLLSGWDFPDRIALTLMAFASACLSAAILHMAFTRWFRGLPWFLFGASVIALGLGNMSAVLLSRPAMYEHAQAAGTMFMMAGAYVLFRLIREEVMDLRELCLAFACFGLALLSRMIHLPAILLLTLLAAHRIHRGKGPKIRSMACIVIPLLLAFSVLFAYNLARFGDPLENGMRYQLNKVKDITLPSPANVAAGAYYHIMQRPAYSGSFPHVFAHGYNGLPHYIKRPKDYLTKNPMGLHFISPIAFCILLLPAVYRGLKKNEEAVYCIWALALAWASTASVLLLYPVMNARYVWDYAGYELMLAIICLYWVIERIEKDSMGRAIGISVFLALTAATALLNLWLSAELSGIGEEGPRGQALRMASAALFWLVSLLFW